ncbi:MAG: hypothetical protein KBS74_03890 [Clostridiales bacterium]|nr:hypothetical protein [Candidatus Cacconaster stercorequi]
MKVLLLSCNCGGGHNAVAQALREAFEAHGAVCTIADALQFISSAVSSAVSRSHAFAYCRAPILARRIYEQAETAELTESSLPYRILSVGARRLSNYILAGRYDTVLCTHVFAGMMLSACCARYGIQVRSGIVETDYTNSPGASCCREDRYFIPDACFAPCLTSRGIEGQRIIPCGIPVRGSFYRTVPSEQARIVFGVVPTHKHLVMMCGSMGCGPMESLTATLAQCMGAGRELTVLCGGNRQLRRKLEQRYSGQPQIHIRGYTENISLLLDSADALLTKPGGSSVTEAAVKGVPMVLTDTVGGCETHNAAYLIGRGLACMADNVPELAMLCLREMTEPRRERAPFTTRPAAEVIYETMTAL